MLSRYDIHFRVNIDNFNRYNGQDFYSSFFDYNKIENTKTIEDLDGSPEAALGLCKNLFKLKNEELLLFRFNSNRASYFEDVFCTGIFNDDKTDVLLFDYKLRRDDGKIRHSTAIDVQKGFLLNGKTIRYRMYGYKTLKDEKWIRVSKFDFLHSYRRIKKRY